MWNLSSLCGAASLIKRSLESQIRGSQNVRNINRNPKTAGEVNLPSPITAVVFQKTYLLKRGWNPGFFVTFNTILKHIVPENFIEFPLVVQKIWITSLSILTIFINFPRFFRIFWYYLVTKKLMMSAYNR